MKTLGLVIVVQGQKPTRKEAEENKGCRMFEGEVVYRTKRRKGKT